MQKWQIELYNTPLWILTTFSEVAIILIISAVFLRRYSQFGNKFWQIVRPCLNRKNNRIVLLVLAILLIFLLTEVRLNVLSTFMSNGLYTSMQRLNIQAFWTFAAMNAGIVLLRTFNGVINDFLDQSLAIKWSEKLNAVLIERWLHNKNYYRLQMRHHSPDNIDQRIQQDAQEFIASTMEFIRGTINSVVSSIQFGLVLWSLSGILQIFGFTIPRGLVFFVFTFVLLATTIAMWIGKPLIRHNYENEKCNGDYRYALIRIRDHAESIAFYHGESHEQQDLSQRFASIIRNRWRIARQSVSLNGFNEMFSQSIQLLPILLQAPRVFAKQIEIGDVQQTVQSFSRLQRALSFFRLFYNQFAAYRARLERLSGFLSSTEINNSIAHANTKIVDSHLKLENITLYRPNQEILLANIHFQLKQGESLLIQGTSGCGKTSLLRMLAGLWHFGSSGNIERPSSTTTLFVPQRPYVPLGNLRDALSYPHACTYTETELHTILTQCHLGHLTLNLDKPKDWQHVLSPGELQRLSFARILLQKPHCILLDEATSALDEATEANLYRLIREQLPNSIIVSIGHRCTLSAFHQHSLTLPIP